MMANYKKSFSTLSCDKKVLVITMFLAILPWIIIFWFICYVIGCMTKPFFPGDKTDRSDFANNMVAEMIVRDRDMVYAWSAMTAMVVFLTVFMATLP